MKLTPWMLAVAAFLIVSVLAIGFIFKKMFAAEPMRRVEPARENVPVVLSDVEPGTTLQAAFLAEAPILRSTINEHRDTVKSRSAVIGRIAREHIPMATPLRLSMFYPIGDGPGIQLAPENRLVSINVGSSTGMVSGLVKSGDYVDVLMTVDGRSGDPEGGDAMVLQLFDGIRVFAVNGNSAGSVRGDHHEVVLVLTPQQQQVMVLAKEKGRISLSYNPQGPGPGGSGIHTSRNDRVLLSEILGATEPPPPAAKPFVTEQYRNGDHTNAYYDEFGNPVHYHDPAALRPGGSDASGDVPVQRSGTGNRFSTGVDQMPADKTASRAAVAGS